MSNNPFTIGDVSTKEFNDITTTLKVDNKVLEERVNGLEKRIEENIKSIKNRLDEEIDDRKSLSTDIKSERKWHIAQFISIIIAVIGFLLTYYTSVEK